WTSRWEGRRISYEVTGEQRRGDRNCWEVTGQTDTARRQTLLIDKESGLLVSANLRVFMGQGDRFNLQLDLEQETTLNEQEAEAEARVATAVILLQEQLGVDPDSNVGELSADQLATLEQGLPSLAKESAGSSWERFVESMSADVAADRRRNQSVAALAARRLGKPAPELTLLGIDGRPIDLTAQSGKPIVLHFWEYRGNPESPFGQVGYLDFLAGKLKADGVQVYGVAVDERLADRTLTPVVRREVQKFGREFIRVSYPIAVDDGALLARFGDPRPLETPLPLWVVIAPDGTVAHFHAGLYTIDPNRGLEELREVLQGLLSPSR
ncbi:MAG: TlpA family protein disulfide reductase, partial [Planctomycetaceae bacterium]|nr:TlpA family protein disulfide reductase [Planctomycetaceae bacterium]